MEFYTHLGGKDWLLIDENYFCCKLRIAHTHNKAGYYLRMRSGNAMWLIRTKGEIPGLGELRTTFGSKKLPVYQPVNQSLKQQ